MTRFFRSSSVRFALGYAGLFVASSLLLVGLLWWRTAGYLDQEIDAVILSDTRAVGDRLRDFGLVGAIQTVKDRAANGDKHAVYLLVNPVFERLAGNLSGWPAEVGYTTGWHDSDMKRDGEVHATKLLNVALPGGFHLLVGRDIEDREQIRALIFNGLAWATLAALILAASGALVARRSLVARVDVISRTAAAIVRGDLEQRVPDSGASDEFDRLGRIINQMLEQIQTLIEGVRNVSNAVAHDLRTPLTEARARLEEVLLEKPAPEIVFSEIGETLNDIDRLIEMSNALLRLAEIDSGVRRSGFREFDLADIATEVAELYQPVADAKKIAFSADAPAGMTIHGDPFLLAQALGNLVDNAVKYTPEGGSVRLSVALDEQTFALTVTDSGPGIPDAEKDRVAARFYRGDSSRGKAGVGLGLSLVASVAKLHGGSLSLADNKPGLRAVLILPG